MQLIQSSSNGNEPESIPSACHPHNQYPCPILILLFCLLPSQVRRYPRCFPTALIPLPSRWSAVHSVVRCTNDSRRHVRIVVMYLYKFSINFVVLKSRYFLEYFVFESCNLCSSSKFQSTFNPARPRKTTETIIIVYYVFIFNIFESTRFVKVFELSVAYFQTSYFSESNNELHFICSVFRCLCS